MNQGPAKNYLHTELRVLWVVPWFPGGGINSDACFLQITFYVQISKQFTKAASPITPTLEKE